MPQLFEHFIKDKIFYLVQEYINGKTIHEKIKSEETFTEKEVRKILEDILQILEFIHRRNVIHRDIKPANLIERESDNKICLIDFGAGKTISNWIATRATIIGTNNYMPWEQVRGYPQPCSDIY
ncbi:MAG: protein kinase, partial [Moorea sp. SIO2B7]|nr:protein kinase [Moorena sp. SIO2B7]